MKRFVILLISVLSGYFLLTAYTLPFSDSESNNQLINEALTIEEYVSSIPAAQLPISYDNFLNLLNKIGEENSTNCSYSIKQEAITGHNLNNDKVKNPSSINIFGSKYLLITDSFLNKDNAFAYYLGWGEEYYVFKENEITYYDKNNDIGHYNFEIVESTTSNDTLIFEVINRNNYETGTIKIINYQYDENILILDIMRRLYQNNSDSSMYRQYLIMENFEPDSAYIHNPEFGEQDAFDDSEFIAEYYKLMPDVKLEELYKTKKENVKSYLYSDENNAWNFDSFLLAKEPLRVIDTITDYPVVVINQNNITENKSGLMLKVISMNGTIKYILNNDIEKYPD